MKTFLREALFIVIAAVLVFFLLQVAFQKARVDGYCMEPGLQDGQQLLINKVVYYFHEPERGDIIVLRSPVANSPISPLIKRIIALPGDTIEVKDRAVYVNGQKLSEPYIKEPPSYNLQPQKVPEDEYFVLGDNRNVASDSHYGWTVPRQNIIGKAWLSIWPPSLWGLPPNYPLGQQVAGSGG